MSTHGGTMNKAWLEWLDCWIDADAGPCCLKCLLLSTVWNDGNGDKANGRETTDLTARGGDDTLVPKTRKQRTSGRFDVCSSVGHLSVRRTTIFMYNTKFEKLCSQS